MGKAERKEGDLYPHPFQNHSAGEKHDLFDGLQGGGLHGGQERRAPDAQHPQGSHPHRVEVGGIGVLGQCLVGQETPGATLQLETLST